MARPAEGEWRAVAEGFAVAGEWRAAEPLPTGHIHRTWVARCATPQGERRYVLQAVNTAVFPDPHALMRNLERVTAHLARAAARRGVPEPHRRCLELVAARDGRAFVEDAGGTLWRAFPFIEGTRAHDTAETPGVAEQAGRVFGEFAAWLADWPPPPPEAVIPGFHDLAGRLAALEGAISRDAAERVASVAREIDAARTGAQDLGRALADAGADAWPRRVVHNDCKLNNVLYDARTGEGLCAVDLDTVMEGHLLFDLGEAARSATCPAPEDERDLAKVGFDVERFGALVRGYALGLGDAFAPSEREGLALAGPRMTLENAVRFLADHLDGDVYFAARRPGHNLDRARAQLRLFEAMWSARDAARAAAESALRSLSRRPPATGRGR